jgi:DNA-binding response OmpR family regulator
VSRRTSQSQAQQEREGDPFVLAVDSDSDLLEWLEAALSRRGIFCACAPDVEHALKIAARRRPDIVLLNADITNGAGVPSLEEFRKAEAIQDASVYLMTGLPDAPAGAPPVAGVLRKPFSIDEVTETLRNRSSDTG